MAEVNKYSPDREAGTITPASKISGSPVCTVYGRAEIAAADDDGSKYILATVDADLIVKDFKLYTAAAFAGGVVQGGSDFDVGIHLPYKGAVIDKDKFADGLNLTSNGQRTTPHNGLTTLSTSQIGKTVRDIALDGMGTTSAATFNRPHYDIVLTGNTVGTSAAVVSFIGEFSKD